MKKLFCLLLIFAATAKCDVVADNWIDSISKYGREVLMPAEKYKWDWGQATMLNAIVHQYRESPENKKQEYSEYIKSAINNVQKDINGKHPNSVASGHGVDFLAGLSEEDSIFYKPLADRIFADYLLTPRTSRGGVSHRVESVELWDDTIYMLSMYFFEMYRLTGDKIYLDHFFSSV